MTKPAEIRFIDNTTISANPGSYVGVVVDVPLVLQSWQSSLFSFEWLYRDGRIKSAADLPVAEKAKREAVEQKLRHGASIEKPVLGIGMMENIEIGSGRAEFLTLAAHGIKTLPVHIPKSNESDFKDFLAGVNS